MPSEAPTTTVDSPWMRVLEASILVPPVAYALVIALGGLTTLLPAGTETVPAAVPSFGTVLGEGTLVVVALGLLFYPAIPVALVMDARAVRRADLPWEPSGPLYALTSLFVGGLASLDYLYRRHRSTADGTTHEWTWYLVAQFLVVAPGATVLAVVGHPVMLSPLALSAGVFLVGLYRDAAYVGTRSDEWRPNPVNWYVVALISAVFLVGPLLIGAYYLFRRRRAVGLGEDRPPAGATTARSRHH